MLPLLKSTAAKHKKQIVSFRGINYSDAYQDGDLSDSLNISTRRYPFLTTRRARMKMDAYSDATALGARDGLVVVQGTRHSHTTGFHKLQHTLQRYEFVVKAHDSIG